MLRLLKYEFRKTLFCKVILLALMGVLEAGFLFGLYVNGNDNVLSLSVVGLTLLPIFGVLVVGLQSIMTLHKDMNSRQGYMLFMTPHSSYTILGAKVLECFLSILGFGVFCTALGALDIHLILSKFGSFEQYLSFVNQMLRSINEEIQLTGTNILSLSAMFAAGWMCTIVTAFLADIIASALLRGKKLSGLICFVLFILLNMLLTKITGMVPHPAGVSESMLFSGALSLIFAVVMYIPSAIIMEAKLSV